MVAFRPREERPIRTHYLNADFDLGLRPRPRQLARPALVRQVRELSFLGVLGADAGDAALVRAEPAAGWLAALGGFGQPAPRLLMHPAIEPAARFRPFGWSAEAIALNAAHDEPAAHPGAACVRRVNSRSYALELESELFPEDGPGTAVGSLADLESHLNTQDGAGGYMLKADFGNAGLGNRRVRGAALGVDDRRFVTRRLAEDDVVVVEPWRERIRDWSVVFDVPFDPAGCRIYETLTTADGALLGAWFEPDEPTTAPRRELSAAAARIADRLGTAGYAGPVCLDAFEWSDGGRPRLRRLVDLNARRALSDGAWRLARRIFDGRTVLFRFFARSKLRLPDDHDEAARALADDALDPSSGHGVAIVSPLTCRHDGATWRPTKVAVFVVGPDRADVERRELRLRERLVR